MVVLCPQWPGLLWILVQETEGSSKILAKYDSRHVSEHKNMARFSPDGRPVATGSADTSINLFEVDKVLQMMVTDGGGSRESPIRPVIRTFYDHMQVLKTAPSSTFCFYPWQGDGSPLWPSQQYVILPEWSITMSTTWLGRILQVGSRQSPNIR